VIVKISPDFHEENLRTIVPALLDAGIGIVNYGNTRRIDEPRLSQRTGGLSGPAIFPAMLDNVRALRARFGSALEIIATGGIHSPETARQALDAGATACGYFTAFITEGPLLARRILDSLLAARK
jgi:dihydroorotate dehydrogenase